jgi:uncharacterized surface anchored protein
MKKKQALRILTCALIILQLLPFYKSLALIPSELGRTEPGDISKVVQVNEAETATYVSITDKTDVRIDPGLDGNYTNVPLDAKIKIRYEFILPDDNGMGTEYSYISGDELKVQLPWQLRFTPPADTRLWTPGNTDYIGTMAVDSNGLVTVTFDNFVEENSEITGWFEIEGTFKPEVTGSTTPVDLTIGSKIIRITPADPPPVELGLTKSGTYNAAANEITWTVKVTVPQGETAAGVSLEDVYGLNQTYKAGSFSVNAAPVADENLTLEERKITMYFRTQ